MTLGYFTSPAFGLAQMAAGRGTRGTTTAQKMRRDRIKSGLRSAYAPEDPVNALGGRIGMIGDLPAEPLPPVGAYAAGRGLDRMSGERGGIGYSPQYGYQTTGHTAFDGGPIASGLSPAQQWRQQNPASGFAGYKPRVTSERRVYSPQGDDIRSFALKRLRGGLSLNEQERNSLAGLEPEKLASLLAGSYGARKAAAKETVRQRGLARGAARASARQYGTLASGGVPEPLAAMMLSGGMGAGGGGQLDPMVAALSGLLPPNAAAAFQENTLRNSLGRDELAQRGELGRAEIAQRQAELAQQGSLGQQEITQRGELGRMEMAQRQAELAQKGKLGRMELRNSRRIGMGGLNSEAERNQMTLLAGMMESDDPILRSLATKQVKQMYGDMESGAGTATLNPDGTINLNLTADDTLALQSRAGDPRAIESYGKSKGWSEDKIAAVKQQFPGNWLMNQLFPSNEPFRNLAKRSGAVDWFKSLLK